MAAAVRRRLGVDVPLLVGGRLRTIRPAIAAARSSTRRPASVHGPRAAVHGDEIDRAVEVAADALPAWAETPAVERARVMFRFRELMHAQFEELAALVTREHGKTLAEARAEMQRGIEMVEFACGIPSLLMGQCAARTSRRASIAKRAGIRSASASASRRSTSRRWCRCGCSRSPSPAATRSS